MSLALELAEKVRSNVHFAEESMKYYLDLEKEGHGRKDFGYVFQYINREQKSKSDWYQQDKFFILFHYLKLIIILSINESNFDKIYF